MATPRRTTRRPDAPYYMPEKDVDTLREMYEKDNWKGRINNCRDLLEEAYKEYKATNKKAQGLELPDTFKELLDKEQAHGEQDKTTFPDWLYLGVIWRANFIIDDTYSAEATLQGMDAGNFSLQVETGHKPRILRTVTYKPNVKEKDMKHKFFYAALNAELFARPEKCLQDLTENLDTEKEKAEIEKIQAELSEASFRDVAAEVAKEIGADIDDLLDPERRTEEQRAALIKKIREEISKVNRDLAASLYKDATWRISTKGRTSDKISTQTAVHIGHYAAAYYFAKHPKKNYRKAGELTDKEEAELLEIYDKVLSFVEGSQVGTPIIEIIKKFIEAENPEAKEQEEIIKAIVPLRHIIPDSTMMNYLAGTRNRKPINAGDYDLIVIPEKGKQKEIRAHVIASYTPDKKNIFSLNEYERNVSDALCSIWEQALKTGDLPAFDIDSLYRAMPGGGGKASPQQEEEIRKTLYKLKHLDLDIDATEEMRKRKKIDENQSFHVKDMYISLRELELSTKRGQRKKGEEGSTKKVSKWIIKNEPPILEYTKMTGQIITVKPEVIQIKKVGKDGKPSLQPLKMNQIRQNMVSYMLRRVANIEHDYKTAQDSLRKYLDRRTKNPDIEEKTLDDYRQLKDVIKFDTIFKEAGNYTEDRTQRKRDKDFCLDVLNYWKAINYIPGYELQKDGQQSTGIIITH